MLRQPISVGELNDVIARMEQTGLFASIGYRYSNERALGELALTFEVKEPEWKVRVVFDNFAWFSDEELTRAVEAEVPTFDGTLPMTEGVTALMVRALESLLKLRDLAGPVILKRHLGNLAGTGTYVFSVENATFPICAVSVTGTTDLMAGHAVSTISGIVGTAYLRSSVAASARFALTELFQKHGYLTFAESRRSSPRGRRRSGAAAPRGSTAGRSVH